MARYIDADTFEVFKYELVGGSSEYRDGFDDGVEYVLRRIDDIPTADVVEVVRCKDCDYSMGITEKKCPMWENIGDPNGYCKWWQSTTIFHK